MFSKISIKHDIINKNDKNNIIIKRKLNSVLNTVISKINNKQKNLNNKNYDIYINYMRELKKNKSPNKFDNYNHIH